MRFWTVVRDCLETRYYVDLPNGRALQIRLGKRNHRLDRLLNGCNAQSYVYMTAYNPRSATQTEQENQQRHRELVSDMERLGYRYLTGVAYPRAKRWPPEVCLMIFNMPACTMHELAQTYVQDVMVVGEHNGPARLFFSETIFVSHGVTGA